MFQHGSLQEVVDQEKEPCGCPPEHRPGSNDFPLAESAGIGSHAPPVTAAPPTPSAAKPTAASPLEQPLVYEAQPLAADEAAPSPATEPAPQASTPAAAPPANKPVPQKKRGFFHGIGHFFRKIFGAE
jgi:hypothetical protein